MFEYPPRHTIHLFSAWEKKLEGGYHIFGDMAAIIDDDCYWKNLFHHGFKKGNVALASLMDLDSSFRQGTFVDNVDHVNSSKGKYFSTS